jgi:hypothetical protein
MLFPLISILQFIADIDPVLEEETPYEVPLWIIIIAAVAGILLLGVISIILWKLINTYCIDWLVV